jgi:hypothetical protein
MTLAQYFIISCTRLAGENKVLCKCHLVGPCLKLIHDARNDKHKKLCTLSEL